MKWPIIGLPRKSAGPSYVAFKGMRMGQRETDRDRERVRETETYTERQRWRESKRESETETEREGQDRHRHTEAEMEMHRETEWGQQQKAMLRSCVFYCSVGSVCRPRPLPLLCYLECWWQAGQEALVLHILVQHCSLDSGVCPFLGKVKMLPSFCSFCGWRVGLTR